MQFGGIGDAQAALSAYAWGAEGEALPEPHRSRVRAAAAEPLAHPAMAAGFEALLAAYAELPRGGREAFARVAYQVREGRIAGKGGRAADALAAVMADLGETPAMPEADPALLAAPLEIPPD